MCKIIDSPKCVNIKIENIGIDDIKEQLRYLYNSDYDETEEGIISLYEHIIDKIEEQHGITIRINDTDT